MMPEEFWAAMSAIAERLNQMDADAELLVEGVRVEFVPDETCYCMSCEGRSILNAIIEEAVHPNRN